MKHPDLFEKYGAPVKKVSEDAVKEFIHLVKWNENGNETIMDMGCGPGNVTTGMLLPLLPKTFKELVGVDHSKDMIDYAASKYTQPKVSFKILDVTSKTIPGEFEGAFDHIFSFLCLHMVHDQDQAFKNLNKMLRPGGDMFLTFFKTMAFFDLHEKLSKTEKWGPYIKNLHLTMSPYFHSDNAYVEVENLLKKEGFTDINIHLKNDLMKMDDIETLKKLQLSSIKHFTSVPDELRDEYNEAVLNVARNMGWIRRCNETNTEIVELPYQLFVVVAKKQ